MEDFKVGDKVRTLADIKGWLDALPKGTITTVTRVHPSVRIAEVLIPGSDRLGLCYFKELEAVNEPVRALADEPDLEQEFMVGDSVQLIEPLLGINKGVIGVIYKVDSSELPYYACFPINGQWQWLWLYRNQVERAKSTVTEDLMPTIGKRVIVQRYYCSNEPGKPSSYNGTVGVVTKILDEPLGLHAIIKIATGESLRFGVEYLQPYPIEAVEAVKKPKSLKNKVKAYYSSEKLCNVPEDTLLNCFSSALCSLLNPDETSAGASDDIVRMIAYLTRLYNLYQEDGR